MKCSNKLIGKPLTIILVSTMLLLTACGNVNVENSTKIQYRYASKTEGTELLLSNKEYYDGFCQNDLDYRMQEKNAKMDAYLDFAAEQVMDFSDDEKALLDGYLTDMEKTLKENGFSLPKLDEIVFVKTTMQEESDARGYTHGTQIYLGSEALNKAISADEETDPVYHAWMRYLLWHELFHCLTRCNPEFQEKMYELIHFTMTKEDFQLPPCVLEYHISNPDVEHHNSYATFHINGQDIDCFFDLVTTKHFEKAGDSYFFLSTPVLIPTDGTDIYYTPDQSDNLDEVFGKNTDYIDDPEECMADNFAYALQYGMDGPDGEGYNTPEIIEGILTYLKTN